jgi:hypothetical protein
MTGQQAGGWKRREFLRRFALAGAAGVASIYSNSITAVETQQERRSIDRPEGADMCPHRPVNAHVICPNCCN